MTALPLPYSLYGVGCKVSEPILDLRSELREMLPVLALLGSTVWGSGRPGVSGEMLGCVPTSAGVPVISREAL